MIEIPEEWNILKFKNISKINSEKINEEYPHQNIIYVDIGSIDKFQITDYDIFALDDRPSRAQRIIQKNDVIVSTVRPYLKAFSKINDNKPNMICSTGFAVIRTKNREDSELIFQFVQTKLFEMYMIRQMEGLAYPAVTSNTIANSSIPYPTERNEREKIASILSNVDASIKATQQIIEKMERLKKGLMQELLTKGIGHKKFKKVKWLFGKKIEIPEEWEMKQLKELTTITDGSHHSPPKIDDGFPMATVKNVKGNLIEINSCYRISNEDYTKLVRNGDQPQIGDILFTKDGTVGKTLVYTQKEKIVLLSSIAIILKSKNLDSFYCNYALQSKFMKKHLAKFFGGTAIKRIILRYLAKFEFPVSPLPEQQKIASILSGVDAYIQKNQEYKKKLEKLKKGLMQNLLTGKIRVKT